MRAVMVLARTGLRGSRARTALVLFVLASSLGFALFAATGARRTATAFDRFVAWADPPDATTSPSGDQTSLTERLDVIAGLPAVRDVRRTYGVNVEGTRLPDGHRVAPMRFAAAVAGYPLDQGFERPKVLDGQVPAHPRADEGVIDFVSAERFGLEVGDRIVLELDHDGSAVDAPVEIVGVVSQPTGMPTVAAYRFAFVALGEAFLDVHPWAHDDTTDGLELRLHEGAGPPGVSPVEALRQEMAAAGVENVNVGPPLDSTQLGAERLFDLEATAMWLAATLALLTGLPIAYQLVRRDASTRRGAVETLRALGASRRQLALAAAVRGAALGAGAAVFAAGGAVAASPLSPVGLARFAEVEDGIVVDRAVLGIGLPALVTAAAALSATAVWRGALTAGTAPARARRPIRIGGRVPIAIGLRQTGASRGTVSALGIGALIMTTLVAVALAVTARSVRALPEDARLAGGVWDAYVLVEPDRTEEVSAALDEVTEVRAHGAGGWIPVDVEGQMVYALSLPRVRGMEAAMVRGRAPRALDEVAFGGLVLDRLGLDVGDEVDLAPAEGKPFRALVTGETIAAAPLFLETPPDDFALVTFDVSSSGRAGGGTAELLRFAPGLDPEATIEDVLPKLPERSVVFYFSRGQRGDVIALARLNGLVNALLTIVAGLALASLVHELLVSSRRHATSLAVLRAVGMERRDIMTVGASSGAATAVVSILVGLPVGLALGSVAWRALARRLMVLPEATIDGATLGAATLALLIGATLLAGGLARRRASGPVAANLRSE